MAEDSEHLAQNRDAWDYSSHAYPIVVAEDTRLDYGFKLAR